MYQPFTIELPAGAIFNFSIPHRIEVELLLLFTTQDNIHFRFYKNLEHIKVSLDIQDLKSLRTKKDKISLKNGSHITAYILLGKLGRGKMTAIKRGISS